MAKYTVELGELVEKHEVDIFDFDYPFYMKQNGNRLSRNLSIIFIFVKSARKPFLVLSTI